MRLKNRKMQDAVLGRSTIVEETQTLRSELELMSIKRKMARERVQMCVCII